MSKGNPVVKGRIPPDVLDTIVREIELRNYHSKREPWDVSGFLRAAVAEFIRKRKASRAPRGTSTRRRTSTAEDLDQKSEA